MPHFRVNGWLVDSERLVVTNGVNEHQLPNKVMQLLCLLVDHQGQVVTHEEIEAEIWDGNGYVARKAATNAVWQLRKIFAPDGDPKDFIETVPRRGYRLNATLETQAYASQKRGGPSFPWALVVVGVLASVGAWFLAQPNITERQSFTREILTDYPGEETEPALSADGRKLAFVWAGKGRDPDIYWKYLDEPGVPPRQVTATVDDDAAPTWSPDGAKIAYLRLDVESRACTVHVHTLASKMNEKIADCQATLPGTLAWSPSGEILAFTYGDETDHGIGLIDLKSREITKLTKSPRSDYPDTDATWSPDGRYIAFTRRAVVETDEVHIADMNGQLRQLEDAPKDLYGIGWSSVADELIVATVPPGEHRRQLMRIDTVSGKSLGLLEQGALEAYVPDMARFAPLIAYDASNFVVSVGLVEEGAQQVVPYHAAGSLSTDREPHISPDGKKLVFTSTRTGTKEIWMHEEGAKVPEQLTSLGVSSVFAPKWAPDNRHIAFLAPGPNDRLQIFLMDTFSRELRQVTSSDVDHMPPNWAPDGRSLLGAQQHEGMWYIHRYQLDENLSLVASEPLAPGYVAQQDVSGNEFIYRLDDEAVFHWNGAEATLFLDGFERRDWGNWAVGDKGVYAILRDDEGDRIEWVPAPGAQGQNSARVIARVPLSLIMDQNSFVFDSARGRFFVAYYAMQQADIFGLRLQAED
ncbi:MAG: PD40 domain-containing protein [Alphaproteobacteria bacterium]|nr:PD40 domain-containing protein [Alphaproteobacteria bacterium]